MNRRGLGGTGEKGGNRGSVIRCGALRHCGRGHRAHVRSEHAGATSVAWSVGWDLRVQLYRSLSVVRFTSQF